MLEVRNWKLDFETRKRKIEKYLASIFKSQIQASSIQLLASKLFYVFLKNHHRGAVSRKN